MEVGEGTGDGAGTGLGEGSGLGDGTGLGEGTGDGLGDPRNNIIIDYMSMYKSYHKSFQS